jgi:hypothetical protein
MNQAETVIRKKHSNATRLLLTGNSEMLTKDSLNAPLQKTFEDMETINAGYMKVPFDPNRLKTFHVEKMSKIKEMLNYAEPERFSLTDESQVVSEIDKNE